MQSVYFVVRIISSTNDVKLHLQVRLPGVPPVLPDRVAAHNPGQDLAVALLDLGARAGGDGQTAFWNKGSTIHSRALDERV